MRVRSYGSTSSLYLEMKDRGAESDEDVGLGLDFEEDDDEFRKCIEDDVPGAPSSVLCARLSPTAGRLCERGAAFPPPSVWIILREEYLAADTA